MALPGFLGRGMLHPFRRDEKSDFANDDGVVNLTACIGQAIGTRRGEIAWRPEFGSRLHLLRHRPNNPALSDLARVYVLEAVQRWERRVRVKKVVVVQSQVGRGMQIDVPFDIVDRYGTVIATDLIVQAVV